MRCTTPLFAVVGEVVRKLEMKKGVIFKEKGIIFVKKGAILRRWVVPGRTTKEKKGLCVRKRATLLHLGVRKFPIWFELEENPRLERMGGGEMGGGKTEEPSPCLPLVF